VILEREKLSAGVGNDETVDKAVDLSDLFIFLVSRPFPPAGIR
jgi:hypothetical protein